MADREMVRGVSGCPPEQKPIGTSRDLGEGGGQRGLCCVKRRWTALPQYGREDCGPEEAQIWGLAKSGALVRCAGWGCAQWSCSSGSLEAVAGGARCLQLDPGRLDWIQAGPQQGPWMGASCRWPRAAPRHWDAGGCNRRGGRVFIDDIGTGVCGAACSGSDSLGAARTSHGCPFALRTGPAEPEMQPTAHCSLLLQ